MTDVRKHFKGQLDDEMIIIAFRKHWVSVLPTLISMPGLWVVLILLYMNLPLLVNQGQWIAYLMVFALGALHALIHRQFLTVFHYYLHTVILTDRRVVLVNKSVFFQDSKVSLDLSNVQDVEKHQVGLFQNMLNYGSLSFMLSGSSSPTVVDLVPRPEYQYKKIHEVKSAVGVSGKPYRPEPKGLAQLVNPVDVPTLNAKMAG